MAAAVLASAATAGVASAATMTINNVDGPGQGFNDTTSATPVGGNDGTTLGEQRLNVFKKAAQLWGDALESVPAIVVDASFAPLACSPQQIVLGQAGPTTFKAKFSGAPPNVFVPIALANAMAGMDLNGSTAEIEAQFNGGLEGCSQTRSGTTGSTATRATTSIFCRSSCTSSDMAWGSRAPSIPGTASSTPIRTCSSSTSTTTGPARDGRS